MVSRRAAAGPHNGAFNVAVALVILFGLAASGSALGGPREKPRKSEEDIWGIRCETLSGPNRVQIAEQRATALKKVKGLKPDLVQVFHATDESSVYYGRYKRVPGSVDKPDEPVRYKPDVMPDLELIRSLSLTVDNRPVWPFLYATVEELPLYRSAHPEWDLNDADGYWTLHVAVFYNEGPITNRRQLAEDYCRALREDGEQAFFHHAAVRSSVYIGLFPKEAVQVVREADPLTGIPTVKNKIVDPRLLDLQRRFPESYQNGQRLVSLVPDPATGKTFRVPTESFIVQTPRATASEGR